MPSKIKKITVSNLKAVSSKTVDLNGCTAIIVGGNGKGKTSLLRALMDRMQSIKPEAILRYGQKEGFYEMELTSGEKLVWDFTAKKEKLTLITEKNIKMSVTKDICQNYFPKVFDVDRFLQAMPKEQVATLKKLSDVDFTEIDRLIASAREERTWANRQAADSEAMLILFEPTWKEEQQDVEVLEKELYGIEAHNMRFKNIQFGLDSKKTTLGSNLKKIQSLKEEIKALEDSDMILETEIDKGVKWISEEKNKPKPPHHGQQLKIKIDDIKNNNDAIVHKKDFEKKKKSAEESDIEVKKHEQNKIEALRTSNLPEGFGFSEDGITYKGFPFDRTNLATSEIYVAALKLAAMGLKEVKALHFDASFLDKNNLLEIEKWAKENDLQLLIERPDFEGGEIEYQIIEN